MADQNIQLKSLDGINELFPITKAANVKRGTSSTVDADLTALESGKQDVLTAGTNIDITNNTISATDTTYAAGTGITISGDNNAIAANIVTAWQATPDDTHIPSEALVKTYVDNKVSAVFRYKGSVATTSDLPTSGQEVGDVYNVQTADPSFVPPVKAGDNVVWAELTSDPKTYGWDVLSGTVDLSNYYTKTQTDGLLDNKVDKVEGSSLMTSAEHTKLAGIAEGAQVNVIESVKVDGEALTITDKAVDIDLSGKIDKSKLSINGSTSYDDTKVIVAPTALGTAGQILKTNSAGTGFVWEDVAEVAVDGTTIGKDADGKLQVKDLGISTAKLAANAVETAKIADSAVTTDKIADANVTHAKLADNAVEAANIKNGEVGTDKLASDAVTNAKLADNAVETANIKDANVTTAKIADGNVTFAKVASAAVVNSIDGIAALASASDEKLPTEKAVRTELDKKVDKVSGSSLVEDTKVASYDAHIDNDDIHVTAAQKTEWSGKQAALTTEQLAAVNSGITTAKVETYDGYATTKVTANTAITAGTNCKITYDAKGLVTAGAALEASDIPSLTLAKISDVTATAAEVNVLDGITATTAELNKLAGLSTTAAELGYVHGVTSAIQTQLDGKLTAVQAGTNVSIDTTTATQPKVSVANFNGTADGCVPKSSAETKGKLLLTDNATWVAGLTYEVVA